MRTTQVIKYEGDNSTFIWKHPVENITSRTELIVHESQEAVLFRNGQALDLFGPGMHILEVENTPILNKNAGRTSNEETPFHCEIYFISMTEQMAVKWGTTSKVEYMDPVYHFPIQIGISGEMGLSPQNARKLLLKLVGTRESFTYEKLSVFLRGILMTKVKTYIAQVMRQNKIHIFRVDENLLQFSEEMKELLVPDFLEYGLKLNHFLVTTVVKPDGEPQYEKFKELHYRQYTDVTEAKLKNKISLIESDKEGYYCEQCGSHMDEHAVFCAHCGERRQEMPACGNCGFVFRNAGNFCPMCGTKRVE